MKTLSLVLTDHWFEEIKSGRKTHEYRICSRYWQKRLDKFVQEPESITELKICFQKAYRKNPERISFAVKSITIRKGIDTDLHIEDNVFDIALGENLSLSD